MTDGIDVVIVNWNGGNYLWECLTSLALATRHGAPVTSVTVVDNASKDGSLRVIDSIRSPINVIRNQANVGFGAACNQGSRFGKADYILFLNPDVRVHKESLVIPYAFLEAAPEYGAVSVRLVDSAGVVSRSCARFPTPALFMSGILGLDRILRSLPIGVHMSDWAHDSDRDVDHVIGAFYLSRRDLFQSLQGFDERFFIYLEDVDLSNRIHAAGYRIRYLATADAFHKGGGTSESIQARRLYYALRARQQYAQKYFSRISAALILVATFTLEFAIRLLFAGINHSRQDVHHIVAAFKLLAQDALSTRFADADALRREST